MTMNDTEKYPVQPAQDESTKRPAVQEEPKAWPEKRLKKGGLRGVPWKVKLVLLALAWAVIPLAWIIYQDEDAIFTALGMAIAASALLVLAYLYQAAANRLKTIPEEQLIIETFGDFCEVKGFQGKMRCRVRTPETYRGMKITAIHGGFARNKRLHTVVVQGAMSTLPDGFLAGCRNLEQVRLPQGLTAISAGMMEKCTRLTCVVVPVNVQSIGSRAFADCAMLRDVYLTSAVTAIADDAFAGCKDMMFHVQPGSEAERFAREKGVNYSYQ